MRKTLLLLTGIMALSTAATVWFTQDGPQGLGALMPAAGGSQEAGSGEALIGGDFSLTDQNGVTVTDTQLRGRLMLVFFGFTHCPDICPVGATSMSAAMELLGDKADQVAPIFITVDPARDTPARLKQYFANFDRRFIALTGTEEQVKRASDAYKVYYSRAEPAKPSPDADHAHHAGHQEDYMVDHSGYIYLMGKDGKYIRHFSHDAKPDELAAALRENL